MDIVLIIAVVALVVIGTAGFVVSARRRRGDVLDPAPATPRVERAPPTKTATEPLDQAEVGRGAEGSRR